MSDPEDLVGWSLAVASGTTALLRLDQFVGHGAIGALRLDVSSTVDQPPYDKVRATLDSRVVNYPNLEYRVSGWVMSDTGVMQPTIGVAWYRADGGFITGFASPAKALTPDTWTYVTFSAFSPIQAAYGTLSVSVENIGAGETDVLWYDELVMSDCVAAGEPLTPRNSTFTSDLEQWQSAHMFGAAVASSESWDGGQGHTAPGALKINVFGGTSPTPPPYQWGNIRSMDPFAVSETQSVQVIVWAKTDNVLLCGEPRLQWFGGSRFDLGSSMNSSPTTQTLNTWEQRTLTATAPTGAVSAEVNLAAVRLNTNATGNVWFDDLLVTNLTTGQTGVEGGVTPLVLPPGALPDDIVPAPGAMITILPHRWLVPGV